MYVIGNDKMTIAFDDVLRIERMFIFRFLATVAIFEKSLIHSTLLYIYSSRRTRDRDFAHSPYYARNETTGSSTLSTRPLLHVPWGHTNVFRRIYQYFARDTGSLEFLGHTHKPRVTHNTGHPFVQRHFEHRTYCFPRACSALVAEQKLISFAHREIINNPLSKHFERI